MIGFCGVGLLVLPGFGYSREGERAIRSLAPSLAADGIELFVPTYIARGGLDVVAWDRAAGARAGLATEARVKVVETLEALVEALAPPRVVWLMLPAGAPTEETLTQLRPVISPGDVPEAEEVIYGHTSSLKPVVFNDETYMPPEVAKALKAQGVWKDAGKSEKDSAPK